MKGILTIQDEFRFDLLASTCLRQGNTILAVVKVSFLSAWSLSLSVIPMICLPFQPGACNQLQRKKWQNIILVTPLLFYLCQQMADGHRILCWAEAFDIIRVGFILASTRGLWSKVKTVYPIKVSWACSSWSFFSHLQATRRPGSPTPRHPELFSCVREEQRGLALLLTACCCSSANLDFFKFDIPASHKFYVLP